MKTLIVSVLALGSVVTQADILPGSLPTLTPFSAGLMEVTYNLAISTQTITSQSEFVIFDVKGFDHLEARSLLPFSVTVELTTASSPTFDDPTLENFRFTYLNLEALTEPQVLVPLAGFIFEENSESVLRAANFATHAYQLDSVEILPSTHRVARHVVAIPEASTWTTALLIGWVVLWKFRFW